MTRSGRTALFLLFGSTGLVLVAAAVLVLTVPSFKQAVKTQWHRWSCPALPEARSKRVVSAEGTVTVQDPFPSDTLFHLVSPNVHFDFDQTVVFATMTATLPAHGRFLLNGTSPAVIRRIGDVSAGLRSISAGFTLTCSDPAPEIRIVMRIDHPDGTLVEWNEKRLRPNEHRPSEAERFSFEWILRDLSAGPDDTVAVFIIANGEDGVWIDDLDLVFRSSRPLPSSSAPHA